MNINKQIHIYIYICMCIYIYIYIYIYECTTNLSLSLYISPSSGDLSSPNSVNFKLRLSNNLTANFWTLQFG